MQLCQMLRWSLLVVSVQLSGTVCRANYSDTTTLSACDYPAEDWYIADTTQTQFPVGYLECSTSSASSAELCSACSCRERRIAPRPTDGVAVAWVVCVQAQDALACVNNGGEFCANSSSNSTVDAVSDGSGSNSSHHGDVIAHVNDSSSGSSLQHNSNASSGNVDTEATSGLDQHTVSTPAPSIVDSNNTANLHSTSAPKEIVTSAPPSEAVTASPTATEPVSPIAENITLTPSAGNVTLVPTEPSSQAVEKDTLAPTGSSSSGTEDSSAASSSQAKGILTFPPAVSSSQAVNEANVITDVVGTVEPSPTSTAVPDIIRPPSNNPADKLDTSNGASSSSSWTSERITTVGTIMCGIAVAAAIAVFVAVRRDNAKKTPRTPGTPADDFTDDNSSLATPMTDRANASRGDYKHNKRDNGYAWSTHLTDASDNSRLASIVVLGPGDDFYSVTSSRQPTHSYTEARGTSSKRVSAGMLSIANSAYIGRRSTNSQTSRQKRVSHDPWMSVAGSSSSDLAVDTMDTKESYSSNAEFDHLSSEQFFESGRSMSFSEPETEWTDTYSSSHGPPTFRSGITEPTSNTIVSLESSRSSLNNSQYASRDTEASEHIHESEDYIMFTNSSSEALSFDAGSTSPEF